MTPISDLRLLPQNGNQPHHIIVLLEGHDATGSSMNWIAQRWRGHLPHALFAMPSVPLAQGANEAQLPEAVTQLDSYLTALKSEFGAGNDDIILVGYAEGASLAYAYGLRQTDPLGAIIGLSGELKGFADVKAEVASRPPTFLVHGELDEVVSARRFLMNFHALRDAGVPAHICFRPALAACPTTSR